MGMNKGGSDDFEKKEDKPSSSVSPRASSSNATPVGTAQSTTPESPYISSDAELSTKEQEYYDVWTEEMGSKPLLQTELDNWVKYGASPDHWRADLKGLIQYKHQYDDKGKIKQKIAVYTQGAVDLLGEDGMKKIKGLDAGSIVVVPKGVGVGQYFQTNQKDNSVDVTGWGMTGDYQWYAATGTPGGGGLLNVVSDVTDIKFDRFVQKHIPGEVKFALDMPGIYGSLIEKDWNKDAAESMGDLLNVDVEDFTQVQAASRAIIKGGLVAAGLAPFAAGVAVLESANMAAQTGNWKEFGSTLVETGLSAYDPTGGLAASYLVNTTMRGMDSRQALKEAVWSTASTASLGLSSYLRVGVDDDWRNSLEAAGQNPWVAATIEAIPGLMVLGTAAAGEGLSGVKKAFSQAFSSATPFSRINMKRTQTLKNDLSFVKSGSGFVGTAAQIGKVAGTRAVFGGTVASPTEAAKKFGFGPEPPTGIAQIDYAAPRKPQRGDKKFLKQPDVPAGNVFEQLRQPPAAVPPSFANRR